MQDKTGATEQTHRHPLGKEWTDLFADIRYDLVVAGVDSGEALRWATDAATRILTAELSRRALGGTDKS